MQANRRYQLLQAATPLTASGNSGNILNIGQSANPTLVAYLDVPNAPSGTTPTLNISIWGSSDGVRYVQLASFAQVNAALANPLRLVIHDVLEPFVQVQWLLGGTSPSFGTNLDLYLTSPDS